MLDIFSQFWNARSPIIATFFCIEISARDTQSLNVSLQITVTAAGIVILLSEPQESNAAEPIETTPLGITISAILLHPLNADSAINLQFVSISTEHIVRFIVLVR